VRIMGSPPSLGKTDARPAVRSSTAPRPRRQNRAVRSR
jgi:hypothetical protein